MLYKSAKTWNQFVFRFSVKTFPKKTLDLFDSNSIGQDLMSTSIYGAFENQHSMQPSPFSAKKVVHESDTAHSKTHAGRYYV